MVAQLPAGFLGLPLKKATPKVLNDLYCWLGAQTSRKAATVLHFHAMPGRLLPSCPLGLGRVDPRVASVGSFGSPCAGSSAVGGRHGAGVGRRQPVGNPENALVFCVLAATGRRRGEVCGLQWIDLDLQSGADQRATRPVGTALGAPAALPVEGARGLSIPEAAQRLGVKEDYVRMPISDGRLVATKTGGRWLIDPGSVAEMLGNAGALGMPTSSVI